MPEFIPDNVRVTPEDFLNACDDDDRAYLLNSLVGWIQDLSAKRIKQLGLDEALVALKGPQ